MGKKATKKFMKTQFTASIKKRRFGQKVVAADKVKEEQKKDYANRQKQTKDEQRRMEDETTKQKKKIENLDVDQMLDGEFFEDIDTDSASDEGVSFGSDIEGEEDENDDAESEGEGEEEEEEDEDGLAGKKNKTGHTKDLDALKKRDPEFYKYMQENDPELLNFDESDAESGSDAESEASEQLEGEQDAEEADVTEPAGDEEGFGGSKIKLLTPTAFAKLKADFLKTNSLKSIKALLHAFRSACHLGDADTEDGKLVYHYRIENGALFNQLVVFCLTKMPVSFNKFLKRDDEAEKKKSVSKLSGWKNISVIVKSYITNLLHLLQDLSDSTMLQVVLKHSAPLSPFFEPFPKLGKIYLKSLLQVWSSAELHVREHAFLNIRTLALDLPFPFIELVMKGIYLTFVRNAKFTNARTRPYITFMENCVVEIYGMDLVSAYQHAFIYIRQMAVHLRNSMTVKTKEAYQQVYNWQFVNCLKVWGHTLSRHADSELKPLVYPFVQIAMGTMRLVPTSRYFPLRFSVVRTLIDLSTRANIYIPLAPLLLEVLNCTDLKKKLKPTKAKPVDIELTLKAPKTALGSKQYQDSIVMYTVELLAEHLGTFACSIGFPEMSVPTVIALRKFSKNAVVFRFGKQVKQLCDKVERNNQFIKGKRQGTNLNPRDVKSLNNYFDDSKPFASPLAQYIDQVRKTAATRREEEMKRYAEMGYGEGDSDDEDGAGGDDESGSDGDREDDEDGDDSVGEGEEEEEDSDDDEDTRKRKAPTAAEKPKKKAKKQKSFTPKEIVEKDTVEDFAWSDDDE